MASRVSTEDLKAQIWLLFCIKPITLYLFFASSET
jgi:hypothetical protein